MKFFFKILRYFNNNFPTSAETLYCVNIIKFKENVPLSDRIISMMNQYSYGYSTEKIAKANYIPEKRAKECIIKGCEVAYELKHKRTAY